MQLTIAIGCSSEIRGRVRLVSNLSLWRRRPSSVIARCGIAIWPSNSGATNFVPHLKFHPLPESHIMSPRHGLIVFLPITPGISSRQVLAYIHISNRTKSGLKVCTNGVPSPCSSLHSYWVHEGILQDQCEMRRVTSCGMTDAKRCDGGTASPAPWNRQIALPWAAARTMSTVSAGQMATQSSL